MHVQRIEFKNWGRDGGARPGPDVWDEFIVGLHLAAMPLPRLRSVTFRNCFTIDDKSTEGQIKLAVMPSRYVP